MKKFILYMLLIAVVTAVIVFAINTDNRIPLIDGLRFDMSPKQAAKILGQPCSIQQDVKEKMEYTFKTDVLGKEATVRCYFLKDRRLTDVYIYWEKNFEGLHQSAYDSLYDHYHDKKYFFGGCGAQLNTAEKHSSIGTDNGSTGMFYDIYETDSKLHISCINLK